MGDSDGGLDFVRLLHCLPVKGGSAAGVEDSEPLVAVNSSAAAKEEEAEVGCKGVAIPGAGCLAAFSDWGVGIEGEIG